MELDNLFKIAPDLEKILSNSTDSIPGLGIVNGLQQNMLYSSATKLAETNKNVPNVDPFAVAQSSTPSIFKQIENKLFALGGITSTGNEMEGGETIQTPNGDVAKLQGASHENGGIQPDLPQGTKVYSKRIVIDGKSMSQRKLDREKNLDKFKKKYVKDSSDIINKNGYERTKEVDALQEYYDMNFQKLMNNLFPQPNKNNKFAYGTDEKGIPSTKGFDWTNPENLKGAYNLFKNDKNLFSGFTDWYRATTNRDYPQDYNHFIDKLQEASTNLDENGKVKTNIYATTYTDPETKQHEISTIPNLGTYLNSEIGQKNWSASKYANDFMGTIIGNNGEAPELNANKPTWDNSNNIEIGTPQSQLDNLNLQDNIPKDSSDLEQSSNPSAGQQYKNEAKQYIGTLGDLVGFGSTVLGGVGPASLTLQNRLGDTPNYNFFNQFGNRALDTNQEATNMANATANEYLRDIDLFNNTSMDRNRASARTINVQRSLDTVTHMQTLKARENITKDLLNTLGQLENQKGQLQNMQDNVVMGNNARVDLANRQDRDNFFSNFNKDLNTASIYGQKMGSDLNKTIQNRMFLQMLPEITQNGVGLNLSDIMGNLQMYDNKGDTKQLGSE